VAVCVLVVSACAVPVIVTVGAGVVVPLDVVVGIVFGAVYRPFVSMVPQVPAVTPVAQVTVHVTTVSVLPVTRDENCWVKFVTTVAAEGEICSTTVDEEPPPPPQPSAPSARARLSSM
jgi:hypothetical protein